MFDIPQSIKNRIQNENYIVDDIGMSSSSILLFENKVLKIQKKTDEADNEVHAMQWLCGQLSVPAIIAHDCWKDQSYLLMTRAAGQMACTEYYLNNSEKLTELLAQALQQLWRIDISDCPLDWTLDRKLKAAEYNVKNQLVDVEGAEPDTFGEDGFENPEALLQWLIKNRPAEELVLSHGDFCLPNIYIDNDQDISFIDLGRMGIADKWQDIALCYRSLKHNYDGGYGGRVYPECDPDLLFEKLEIQPDWEKIRYYILLDELF